MCRLYCIYLCYPVILPFHLQTRTECNVLLVPWERVQVMSQGLKEHVMYQRTEVTSQSVCETDCRSTAMPKHPDMLLVEAVQIDSRTHYCTEESPQEFKLHFKKCLWSCHL